MWDMGRCSGDEIDWIVDGVAVVKDWIVVGKTEVELDVDSQTPIIEIR